MLEEIRALCGVADYAAAEALLSASSQDPKRWLQGFQIVAEHLLESGQHLRCNELVATADQIRPNSELVDQIGLRLAQATGDVEVAIYRSGRIFTRRPSDSLLASNHAELLRSVGHIAEAERTEAIHSLHVANPIESLETWKEPGSDSAEYTAVGLYLDLLERAVCNWIYADDSLMITKILPFNEGTRTVGRDIPIHAHSMIGRRRLRHLRRVAEEVIRARVPGDFLEAGVWRGGACILMRGVLRAHQVTDRRVIVADSFEGLPPPDPRYPADALTEFNFHLRPELAVDLDTVKSNFERYGLLDEQVQFLKGYFRDTLPSLAEQKLAILRLDGDLYSSTMDTLAFLYDRVSPGGYVIIDDYGPVIDARRAVIDFRHDRNILEPMIAVDRDAIFWQKSSESPPAVLWRSNMSEDIAGLAAAVGADWRDNRYYRGSEKDVGIFWSENSKFRRFFSRLRLGHVVDLACGHGKQSQFIFDKCECLYLIDINQENIDACKERYKNAPNVRYIITKGFDFPGLEDGTIDSIFCYDAMVHFAPEVVEAYLKETCRVLKKGGLGLFHHSNLANPPFLAYSRNPHARNRMSRALFAAYAEAAGLNVVESEVFHWGDVADLDCLTLIEN